MDVKTSQEQFKVIQLRFVAAADNQLHLGNSAGRQSRLLLEALHALNRFYGAAPDID